MYSIVEEKINGEANEQKIKTTLKDFTKNALQPEIRISNNDLGKLAKANKINEKQQQEHEKI